MLQNSVNRHRRAAGFTLIEMLVVLGLMGLLSALLFDHFRFASHIVDVGTHILDRSATVDRAANFLQSELAAISPSAAFEGSSGEVMFIAAPPAARASDGLDRFRLGAADYHGHKALMVLVRPNDEEAGETHVLLDNIAGADIAYFGPPGPGRPSSWQGSWKGISGLPQLIRLRITFADGLAVPDIITAPRLAEGTVQ